jgi:hypothetical protein
MAQAVSSGSMQQGSFVPVDPTNGVYAQMISGPTGGNTAVPIEAAIPVSSRATSTFNTGKQAAPTAGTTIATLTVPAQGTYEIELHAFIGGTTVANVEIDNMELFVNGVSQGRVINAVAGTAGASGINRRVFRYDGNGTIAIKANAASTAGSIYVATISATRIN